MQGIPFVVKVIERMIEKDKSRLEAAVKAEQWNEAAQLESYIAGQEQALAVVKLGAD